MKITNVSLNISDILQVTYGKSPVGNVSCDSRISDCFVYILSGSGKYTSDGTTITAKQGDVLFLPHKSRYLKEVSDNNFTHIYVNFFFDSTEIREIEVYQSSNISALDSSFKKLLKLWKFGDFSDIAECKSILYHIYSTIISSAIFSYIPNHQRSAVNKAIKLINENFCNPELSSGRIAKSAEMSEVHFRRIFKQLYRTSPIKYIQNLRIEKAKSLLTDDSLSIADISSECGFTSSYYFARVFKKETGMTPTGFKNQIV